MTRPELRRCEVRGPSIAGMGTESKVLMVVCFDILQFSGTLYRQPIFRMQEEQDCRVTGTHQSSG